jgi:hypothetical protein
VSFHKYGKTVKFPRNEAVDIHVREVTLDVESDSPVEAVEIREFIKTGEVYGHGLVIPRDSVKELDVAFRRLGLLTAPSLGARK